MVEKRNAGEIIIYYRIDALQPLRSDDPQHVSVPKFIRLCSFIDTQFLPLEGEGGRSGRPLRFLVRRRDSPLTLPSTSSQQQKKRGGGEKPEAAP